MQKGTTHCQMCSVTGLDLVSSDFGMSGFARWFWWHFERCLVPALTNAGYDALGIGGDGTWHGIPIPGARVAQD